MNEPELKTFFQEAWDNVLFKVGFAIVLVLGLVAVAYTNVSINKMADLAVEKLQEQVIKPSQ